MVESTVYRLKSISIGDVEAILEKHGVFIDQEKDDKPYVMVIDELNRGNVSKGVWRLITLLEADKRKGRINAESVVLPYSKKGFISQQCLSDCNHEYCRPLFGLA